MENNQPVIPLILAAMSTALMVKAFFGGVMNGVWLLSIVLMYFAITTYVADISTYTQKSATDKK